MNLSDTIDLLIKQDSCFALYRLPWTDEPILLLQEKKDIDTYPVRESENLNVYFGILVMFIFFAIVFVIINVIIIKQIKKNKLFKNII